MSMWRAALAVPQGGAKKTPRTAGCLSQRKTACWSSCFVRSSGTMLVKAPAVLTLSTAMEFEKPLLLKLAVAPPVPAKSSSNILSCSVKLGSSASSQSKPAMALGISSLCAVQKGCALKQFALKHTCRPFLHAPPVGASAHSERL